MRPCPAWRRESRRSLSIGEDHAAIWTSPNVRRKLAEAKSSSASATKPQSDGLLAKTAEKSWRRLDGHNQLSKIILGVRYTDGIEVVKPKAQAAAASPLPSPRFSDSSGMNSAILASKLCVLTPSMRVPRLKCRSTKRIKTTQRAWLRRFAPVSIAVRPPRRHTFCPNSEKKLRYSGGYVIAYIRTH